MPVPLSAFGQDTPLGMAIVHGRAALADNDEDGSECTPRSYLLKSGRIRTVRASGQEQRRRDLSG